MPTKMLYRATGTLFIEYKVFTLGDRDDPHNPTYHIGVGPPMGGSTGLLAAVPGCIGVICGVHTGEITVTVEAWDARPEPDLTAWEDVAEVSVTWHHTQRIAVCGADASGADVVDIPITLPVAPDSSFRVRGSVRHRDAGEDRSPNDPREHHLLQIWPDTPHQDTLLKATDETGEYWRSPKD